MTDATDHCPMHGERETFTAPHVGYTKEPGCTCTMLPSTPMTDATELDEIDRLRAALDEARAEVERLHFDLDREARARQAAEGALAAVRALADEWDRLGTPMNRYAAVADLRAALATPTTTEETR